MGKKQQNKDEAPNPQSVANRDIFQRLSFLYQAGAYLQAIGVTKDGASTDGSASQGETSTRRKRHKRHKVSLRDVGSSYVRNMRAIGNKAVVRMDPNVKRTLCNGCHAVLAPGVTASVRIKGSRMAGHKIAYSCLECRTSRVIPAPSITSSLPRGPNDMPSTSPPTRPSTEAEPSNQGSPSKHKSGVSYTLPLFARQDAGHVVFRGNEMLSELRE